MSSILYCKRKKKKKTSSDFNNLFHQKNVDNYLLIYFNVMNLYLLFLYFNIVLGDDNNDMIINHKKEKIIMTIL